MAGCTSRAAQGFNLCWLPAGLLTYRRTLTIIPLELHFIRNVLQVHSTSESTYVPTLAWFCHAATCEYKVATASDE